MTEHDDGFALVDDLVDQRDEPVQFAGAPGEVGLVVVVGDRGGMVADLLQAGDAGEHLPLARDALGAGDVAAHVVDDGLIQRRLLPRETAVIAHDDALRQLVRDAGIGLVSPQHERRDPLAQCGQRGVFASIDRRVVTGFERGLRAE